MRGSPGSRWPALRLRGDVDDLLVVERAERWDRSGAGLYLPGNAVRALAELGLGAAVSSRANRITRQRFLDRRGRVLAEIDVERYWAGVGGCVALERAALHDVLLDATKDVNVRLGSSDGARTGETPRATFSDGSNESYDLVVGADGVHSTVRSLALGGRPPATSGRRPGASSPRTPPTAPIGRVGWAAAWPSSPFRSARERCTATRT